jgi:c(7)-type cytochrome triheme protein
MKRPRIGMGFLLLGALALAACGGSAEKAGGGAPGVAETGAPQEEAAADQAVEKAQEATGAGAGVVEEETGAEASAEAVKDQAAAAAGEAAPETGAEAPDEAVKEQAATAAGEAVGETQDAAGAASATAGEKVAQEPEAAKEQAPTQAAPGESVVRFENDKLKVLGSVEFSHPKHKEALGQEKLDCTPCHMQPPPLFQMTKRAEGEARYTMADMKEGKACGKCHDGKTPINGKTAFDMSSVSNCSRCHMP